MSKTFIVSLLLTLNLHDSFVLSLYNETLCRKKECILFASSLDKLLDSSKDPCDNFFNFACGKFVKSTVIHDRYGVQGFSTEVADKEDERIRKLLMAPATDEDIRPFRLAKETYKMCINHDQLDDDGAKPLFELIDSLGGWKLLTKNLNESQTNWQEFYEKVLKSGFSYDYIMSMYLTPNPKNSSNYKVRIIPPEVEDFNRGYYDLLPQGLNNSLVKAYYVYMTEFTVQLGANEEDANKEMLEVLEFEQKLFEIRKRKDGQSKVDTTLTLDELQSKFPFVQWVGLIGNYLGSGFNLSASDEVIISDQFYFQNLAELMNETSESVFKNYLFWRIADYAKFFLSVEFKEPSARFHEKLYGRQKHEQQWKRCVDRVKRLLAISVGSMLARSENSDESQRKEANILIASVTQQVEGLINQMPIPDEPKKKLAEKMTSIEVLAGYPQEFFDDTSMENYYKDLEIHDKKFFETVFSAEKFLNKKYGERISKSIRETQWQSFLDHSFDKSSYYRSKSLIYIQQKDLKSPIFNANLPSYVNFARLGWQVANLYGTAIVFELKSSKFPWYEDVSKFIKKDYEDYVLTHFNMSVDGSKSLHVNVADFLCYELVYKAMKIHALTSTEKALRLPGLYYSPEKFFWIASAQQYCLVNKDEETLQKLVLSIFPIESFRANNPLHTNDNFARDFNCETKFKTAEKMIEL